MALSKELEDELTCPVDLELYEEPMSLKCRHILCKKDVEYMTDDDGLLTCPQCKTVSEGRDVRPDFRTQRLLDMHKHHNDEKKRLDGQKVCDNCEHEAASNWCEECEVYLGEKCTRGHMKLKATSAHKLTDIQSIVDKHKALMNASLEEMAILLRDVLDFKDHLNAERTSLECESDDGINQINASEERLVAEVQRAHKQQRDLLEAEMAKRKSSVDKIIAEWQVMLHDFEREIAVLKEFESDNHILLHKEHVDEILKSFLKKRIVLKIELKKARESNVAKTSPSEQGILDEIGTTNFIMESKLKADTEYETANVPIVTNRHRYEKEEAETSFQTTRSENGDSDVTKTNPRSLKHFTTQRVKASFLPYDHITKAKATRIASINDAIWMVMNDGTIKTMKLTNSELVVYNTFPATTEYNATKYRIQNIIQAPRREIVAMTTASGVAALASFMTGYAESVVEIDDKGDIKNIISKNVYSNIVADASYVYGVPQRDGCVVDVHDHQRSGWCRILTVAPSRSATGYKHLAAHCNVVTLHSNLRMVGQTFLRYDILKDTEIRIKFKNLDISKILMNDRKGNIMLKIKDKLIVLLRDNTYKAMNVAHTGKWVNHVSMAAMDGEGRMLLLLEGGAVLLVD